MKQMKLFMVLLLVIALFPISAVADEVRYVIDRCEIEAVVSADGSVKITESIDYHFSTAYNGVLRDIDTSKTGGIKGEVEVMVNGRSLEKVGDVTASSKNSYQADREENLYKLKVFHPGSGNRINVKYTYTFLDAVQKYADVAELNRVFIDRNWAVNIRDVSVRVILPVGAGEGDVKVFGHGPLSGEAQIVSPKEALFMVASVKRGEYVDCRVVFPQTLVPIAKLTEAVEMLPLILEEENALADEANERRSRARALLGFLFALMFLLPLAGIAFIIYFYIKHDKEYTPAFGQKYLRELPSEHEPFEVGYLMDGKIQGKEMLGTLLNLVYKKVLSLKQTGEGKKIRTEFIKRDENIPMSANERNLVSWLIDKLGGGRFSTDDLKMVQKKQSQARKFSHDYSTWRLGAEAKAETRDFYEEKTLIKALAGGFGIFLVIIGVFLWIYFQAVGFAPTIVVGIIVVLWAVHFTKRSKQGNELYYKWKAFKRFLKDFSNMERSTLPEIAMWEYYLVFAVVLGVAEDVIKNLPKVYSQQEMQRFGAGYYHPATAYMVHRGFMLGALTGMSSGFDHSIRSIQAAAVSKNSSGGGFGGGFSGGGSGGGGGGGGAW